MSDSNGVVVIHHGDPDFYAAAFNDGFDTAVSQGLMSDDELENQDARDWLQEKMRIAWEQGFEACLNAAPIAYRTWRIPENPYEA